MEILQQSRFSLGMVFACSIAKMLVMATSLDALPIVKYSDVAAEPAEREPVIDIDGGFMACDLIEF